MWFIIDQRVFEQLELYDIQSVFSLLPQRQDV